MAAAMRLARIFDTVDAQGYPVLDPTRDPLDAAERRRVCDYLDNGGVVLRVGMLTGDRIDPARGDVVPVNVRTDGEWLWSDQLGYYVEHHGIAPEADLYDRIRGHAYQCPAVDRDTLMAASTELERIQRGG